MQIKELRLHSFRNFKEVVIHPDKKLNLFYGSNGAGKSSLLEAFYVLGFGRSFRTNNLNNLYRHSEEQEKEFTIYLAYQLHNLDRSIGFSRSHKDGNQINIDGAKSKRLIDIAKQLPVQLFTPQSSDLIIGPPIVRRRYLDWLVFHVEHQFGNYINAYTKALSQRNSLLKNSMKNFSSMSVNEQSLESDVWKNFLIIEGEKVNELRIKYISLLNRELNHLYQNIFNSEFDVEIRYNKGWPSSLTLEEAIIKNTKKDEDFGYTTVGPHKADLHIYINNKKAAEYLSRGQLRLLVSLLLIAEVNILHETLNRKSLLLIDDIGAELDDEIREKLIDLFMAVSSQVLITAIDKQQFGNSLNNNNKKVFHVKHDQIYEE